MRVLVCGGRDFADWGLMLSVLNELNSWERIDVLIHGAARGADTMAGEWAARNRDHVSVRVFPADWSKHGRTAGPIRNQQMIDEGKPDLVVAFQGGRGTADMIRRAQAAGIKVKAIR